MRAKGFAAIVVALAASAAVATDAPPLSPEQQLQAVLQGYTAGPPQRCIIASRIKKMKIIDGIAITATAGGQVFVNRPLNASILRRNLIPAFEPDAGRLCSGAQVSLQTSNDFFNVGAVRLQDWIPYLRNKQD